MTETTLTLNYAGLMEVLKNYSRADLISQGKDSDFETLNIYYDDLIVFNNEMFQQALQNTVNKITPTLQSRAEKAAFEKFEELIINLQLEQKDRTTTVHRNSSGQVVRMETKNQT